MMNDDVSCVDVIKQINDPGEMYLPVSLSEIFRRIYQFVIVVLLVC